VSEHHEGVRVFERAARQPIGQPTGRRYEDVIDVADPEVGATERIGVCVV
jgi:hypothetical protein